MKPKAMVIVGIIMVLIIGGIVVAKWSGSTAEETAVGLRDEFTGKRVINQGEQLKNQLGTIGAQKKEEADSIFQ